MTFKIKLRPGSKLSDSYANSRDNYKVVETDNVLGYVVSSGGRATAALVYPLYRADIHIKAGKGWHIVSSYEAGPYLNAHSFYDDYEGCTFATIASQAINALEERQRARELADARKRLAQQLSSKRLRKKKPAAARKKGSR